MFNVHHNTAPDPFYEYFVNNSDIHNYRTRARCKLRVPYYKLDIMKMSVRVKGVYIWNFVFSHISPASPLYSFKTSLRKLLLGNIQICNIIP